MHILIGCRLCVNLAFNIAQTRNGQVSNPPLPAVPAHLSGGCSSASLRWDSKLLAARWRSTSAQRATLTSLCRLRKKDFHLKEMEERKQRGSEVSGQN